VGRRPGLANGASARKGAEVARPRPRTASDVHAATPHLGPLSAARDCLGLHARRDPAAARRRRGREAARARPEFLAHVDRRPCREPRGFARHAGRRGRGVRRVHALARGGRRHRARAGRLRRGRCARRRRRVLACVRGGPGRGALALAGRRDHGLRRLRPSVGRVHGAAQVPARGGRLEQGRLSRRCVRHVRPRRLPRGRRAAAAGQRAAGRVRWRYHSARARDGGHLLLLLAQVQVNPCASRDQGQGARPSAVATAGSAGR
jgi:hypothetical protein